QDEPRQALLLDRSHPALGVGVQVRRPGWERHALDPGCVDDLLKGGAIFPIAVMDEVLPGRQAAPLLHRHVACHLDHPPPIRMRRDAGYVDFPAAKVDEKQHVIRHELTQCPDLGGEEVGRYEDVHVCADELFPRRGGLPLWSWRNAMALED